MKNARILIAYILLTLVSSYAWAEKYEYVRLTDGKTVELNAGDAAMVVAYDIDSSSDYLVATETQNFWQALLKLKLNVTGRSICWRDMWITLPFHGQGNGTGAFCPL